MIKKDLNKNPIRRHLRVSLLNKTNLVLILLCAACSPSAFFGQKADQSVLNASRYRRINPDCSKMDLSTSRLSPTTLRAIIKCFNTYGALNHTDQLINGSNTSEGISDQDLQSVADALNRHVIDHKRRLYEIEETHRSLSRLGISNRIYEKFGKVIENGDFVASLINLFKNSYLSENRRNLLKAIELLSTRLEVQNNELRNGLVMGTRIAGASSFQDVLNDLKKTTSSNPSLEDLVGHFYAYINEDHVYSSSTRSGDLIPISQDLNQWLLRESSDPFSLLSQLYGSTDTEIKRKVAIQSGLMKVLLSVSPQAEEPVALEKLANAIQSLNGPISCMQNSVLIPNASMHLFQELSALRSPELSHQYVLRDGKLALLSLLSFCNYSSLLSSHDLNLHYQSLNDVALKGLFEERSGVTHSAVEPLTQLIHTLYGDVRVSGRFVEAGGRTSGDHLLAQFFIRLFSDRGGNGRGGFLHFIPILKELTDRDIWPDLFLTLTLLNRNEAQNDRNFLMSNLRFLISPREDLNQASIVDVFYNALRSSNSVQLFRLLNSSKSYLALEERFLADALIGMIQAYDVNNVHPFIDLLKDVMGHATENTGLLNVLFKISEKREFSLAIKEFSEMAQDGRLNELMTSFIALCHRFLSHEASSGTIVESRLDPSVIPSPVTLTHRGLEPIHVIHIMDPVSQFQIHPACIRMNLGFGLDQLSSPLYETHLQDFLDCLGSGRSRLNQNLVSSIQFLRSQSLDSDLNNNYLAGFINRAKLFFESLRTPIELIDRSTVRDNSSENLDPGIRYLIEGWKAAYVRGDVNQILNALSFWIQGVDSMQGGIAEPMIQMIRPMMSDSSQVHVRQLEDFAIRSLRNESFPLLLREVDELFRSELPLHSSSAFNFDQFLPRMRTWVEAKDCIGLSSDPERRLVQIEERAQKIKREAQHLITDWEIVTSEGGPRQNFTFEEFRERLQPLLRRIKNKEDESDPQHWILDSLLNFFKYYSLRPGEPPRIGAHSRPEDLLKWFYDRSIDYRPLTYFYPGENIPRVMWDNTLGWLAKTLVNTDFVMPLFNKNMALDFAQEIGEAWGDVHRDLWPESIQRKFSRIGMERPKTLREAVLDILNRSKYQENLSFLVSTVGLPRLPDCHRDIQGEHQDPQSAGMSSLFGLLPGSIPMPSWLAGKRDEYQRYLYNLKQVSQVLLDNSEPGEDGSPPGLSVLRDLFFEIHSSTPQMIRIRTPGTQGDRNNLTWVTQAAKLGAMHAPALLLRNIHPNDSDVQDFFKAFIYGASTPQMKEVMVNLIRTDANQELLWRMIEQIFHVMDHGTSEDLATMKKIGFYSMAILNKMGTHEDPQALGFINLSLSRVNEILTEYRPFLIQHVDLLRDLLKSKTAAQYLQVLYSGMAENRYGQIQDLFRKFLTENSNQNNATHIKSAMEIIKSIYDDPRAQSSLHLLRTRWNELKASRSYQNLNVYNSLRPALRFLEELGPEDQHPLTAEQIALSRRIRESLANFLERNNQSGQVNLDQILILMRTNPEQFYQLLQTLSEYIREGNSGSLQEFLEVVWRSLSEGEY